MTNKFFEAIKECNINHDNRTFIVIKGEGLGEKAVLSNNEAIYLSDENNFLYTHYDEILKIHDTGVFMISNSLVYSELIGTQKKLIICGAGHVSIPIIRLGKMIGFHVTVIDDRDIFVDNAFNAGADKVICDEFEKAIEKISGDLNSYFVVVTRGHKYDFICLREILNKTYAYVGMMGSRRRVKIVKESLINEGFEQNSVMNIHAPIGLSINAETPEEISISIMAEIIQLKNQKKNIEIPEEILKSISETGRKVLCTIVSKKGAAPRNIGTKMLCIEGGKTIGTIGGGLMEAKIIQKAKEILNGKIFPVDPVLMQFELNNDNVSIEGEVCGGVIEVLVECI